MVNIMFTQRGPMRILVAAAMAGAALAAPFAAEAESPPPIDLTRLQDLHATSSTENAQKAPYAQLRTQAMVEAATALGAQHGLRWRARKINGELRTLAPRLDRIYDFRTIMLDGGMVVPPVIEEARSTWTGDAATARSAQVEYHIIAPARIAPATPNWRTWLLQSIPAPMRPDPALLPRTPVDHAQWAAAVQQGWHAGVGQANAIFLVNLNRLQRDLTGMLLFLRLQRQGMVSAPMLANGQVGVEVSGRALAIGQRIFRLTMGSSFQPADRWHATSANAPVLPLQAAPPSGTATATASEGSIGFVGEPPSPSAR